MADLEKILAEVIELLKPLKPQKIILFGSYAYGKPDEDSDIDLLIIKEVEKEKVRKERLLANQKMWQIIKKYNLGFDIFVDSPQRIQERIEKVQDQFYSEIMEKGKVIYAK